MVTIIDYKVLENQDGDEFFALVVQGGVEKVRSQQSGKDYLTVRKATIPCTFDEQTCKGLLGSELDGRVIKTLTDPYEYAIPGTGELITLEHTYEYVSDLEEEIHMQKQALLEAA